MARLDESVEAVLGKLRHFQARPVARLERPLDLAEVAQLKDQAHDPGYQAGVSAAFDERYGGAYADLEALCPLYLRVDEPMRQRIREAVARHTDLARAISCWWPGAGRGRPRDELRRQDAARWLRLMLVRISIADAMPDPRDAQLEVEELARQARVENIDAEPILRELAAMSAETARRVLLVPVRNR